MKRKEDKKKKAGMAFSQILILLISIVAISYALGSEIGFVSAAPSTTTFTYAPPGGTTNTYTLSDATSGCRVWLGIPADSSPTLCYAFLASANNGYGAWYLDVNHDGTVEASEQTVPTSNEFLNAVYNALLPPGYSAPGDYVGSFTYSGDKRALWKNSAGNYVATWGQYLYLSSGTGSSRTWKLKSADGIPGGSTNPAFATAANDKIASLTSSTTAPTSSTQTNAQPTSSTATSGCPTFSTIVQNSLGLTSSQISGGYYIKWTGTLDQLNAAMKVPVSFSKSDVGTVGRGPAYSSLSDALSDIFNPGSYILQINPSTGVVDNVYDTSTKNALTATPSGTVICSQTINTFSAPVSSSASTGSTVAPSTATVPTSNPNNAVTGSAVASTSTATTATSSTTTQSVGLAPPTSTSLCSISEVDCNSISMTPGTKGGECMSGSTPNEKIMLGKGCGIQLTNGACRTSDNTVGNTRTILTSDGGKVIYNDNTGIGTAYDPDKKLCYQYKDLTVATSGGSSSTSTGPTGCLAGHGGGEQDVGGLTFYVAGNSNPQQVNLDPDTCVTSDQTSADGVRTILTNKGDQMIYNANTGKVSIYNTDASKWIYGTTTPSIITSSVASTSTTSSSCVPFHSTCSPGATEASQQCCQYQTALSAISCQASDPTNPSIGYSCNYVSSSTSTQTSTPANSITSQEITTSCSTIASGTQETACETYVKQYISGKSDDGTLLATALAAFLQSQKTATSGTSTSTQTTTKQDAATTLKDVSGLASTLGVLPSNVDTAISTCSNGVSNSEDILTCVKSSIAAWKALTAKTTGSKTTKASEAALKTTANSAVKALQKGASPSSLLGVSGFLYKHVFVKNLLLSDSIGNIIEGAAIASTIYYGGNLLLNVLGISGNKYAQATKTALAWGWLAGQTTYGLFAGVQETGWALWGPAIGVGIVVGGIAFLLAQSDKNQKAVIFTCAPWQAPTGGNHCGECGQNGLPCTQYECQSLGQACQIRNTGQNQSQVCVWVNKGDVTPPTMQFWAQPLSSDYTYKTATGQEVTPPNTGVKISYKGAGDGAIPAYSALTLGVHTNEPATCRMDLTNKANYSSMQFLVDSGLFEENHTVQLSVPKLNSSKSNPYITPDGQVNVYVRCKDANNNTDVSSFVMQFNVQQGPDTQPPIIEGTSVGSSIPVYSGIDNMSLMVYTNEPVNGCRWDHSDVAYSKMTNNLTCSNSVNPVNGYYGCDANLTGIKDNSKNFFYFRCNDTSGNIDETSYILDLLGTQPLVIDSVAPNDTTVTGSTNSVQVTLKTSTSAGYDNGNATCYYKVNTAPSSAYTQFSSTGSYLSTQDLWLQAGNYTYNIRCNDLGGNSAYANATFNIKTDTTPPVVTRIYHDNANLVITTNENATCVYDVSDCNYPFSSGVSMTDAGTLHTTSWVTQRTYYIKCEDKFGNQPDPNQCTAVVQPSNL